MRVASFADDNWLTRSTVVPETEIRVERIFVTPALAKHWLSELNVRNRSMSPDIVARYGAKMRDGLWTECTDLIGFYAFDGALMNGQQRLAAIVESGVGRMMFVMFGLPEEAMNGQDQGRRRTAKDVFELVQGERRDTAFVAAHKMVLILRRVWSGQMAGFGDTRNAPDTTDMLALAQEEFLDGSFQTGRVAQRSEARIPAAIATALHYEMARAYGDDLTASFFHRLADGQRIDETMPEFSLRRALIRNRSSQTKYPAQVLAALVIKSFNMRALGQQLEALSYSLKRETFPKLGQGLDRVTVSRREREQRRGAPTS